MVIYIAVIVIVSILEIKQMVKEKLKKEIVLFIPLTIAAIALASLYSFRPEVSISGYFLKLLGIAY